MSDVNNSTTPESAGHRAPNASGIDFGNRISLKEQGADDLSYLGGGVVDLEVTVDPVDPPTIEETILTPQENLAKLAELRELLPSLGSGKTPQNTYVGATTRYVIDKGMPMHSPADPLQPPARRKRPS